MKKIPYYACEICGRVHQTEKAAEACEKYHVRPKKGMRNISKKLWPSYPGPEMNKYPAEINVEMDDGSVWVYEIGRRYKNSVQTKECPD